MAFSVEFGRKARRRHIDKQRQKEHLNWELLETGENSMAWFPTKLFSRRAIKACGSWK